MSSDLEDRLHRDLSTLDDRPIDDGWSAAVATGSAVARMRRRRRGGVGVVAAALVVSGATGLWLRSEVRDDEVTVTEPLVTEPSVTEPLVTGAGAAATSQASTVPGTDAVGTGVPDAATIGSWRVLAADPRGTVFDSAAVWADGAAIVVGGRTLDGRPVAAAARYVPARDEWEPIADPPATVVSAAGAEPIAVWTGEEVILLGGIDPDGVLVGRALEGQGAAYDPVADRWRSIAPPPGSVSARSPWTWTGDELLVWPDGAVGEAVAPAAYDPATDRWRDLPTPPVASRQEAASVWTGGEWLLWGGADGRTSFGDGAAYDPATGAWRVLPASPLSPRRAGGVWTGGELLVAAGSTGGDPVTGNGAFAHGDGAAYDPATDEWRRIADGPAHPGFEAVWTGERLLLFAKGAMFVYDPATDRWSDGCCDGTPAAVAAAPVWTGEEALLVGSAESGRGGIAFRPAS